MKFQDTINLKSKNSDMRALLSTSLHSISSMSLKSKVAATKYYLKRINKAAESYNFSGNQNYTVFAGCRVPRSNEVVWPCVSSAVCPPPQSGRNNTVIAEKKLQKKVVTVLPQVTTESRLSYHQLASGCR